jgi:hypothetical protein
MTETNGMWLNLTVARLRLQPQIRLSSNCVDGLWRLIVIFLFLTLLSRALIGRHCFVSGATDPLAHPRASFMVQIEDSALLVARSHRAALIAINSE